MFSSLISCKSWVASSAYPLHPHALEAGAVDVAHLMFVELCLVDGDDEGRPGPALQYLSPPAILCVEKLKPVLEQ